MNSTISTAASSNSSPKQPRTFEEAMELLNTNTFRFLINPDHQLMWETINILPETVYCMPQATAEMQIAALRRVGSLLLGELQWKFDTELLFPGSTQWAKVAGPKIRWNHTRTELEVDAIFKAIEASWEPLAKLSVLAERGLKSSTRMFLRDVDTESAASFVSLVLEGGSDSLSVLLNAGKDDCANDDMMVITAKAGA
jgi:hypothetical protein